MYFLAFSGYLKFEKFGVLLIINIIGFFQDVDKQRATLVRKTVSFSDEVDNSSKDNSSKDNSSNDNSKENDAPGSPAKKISRKEKKIQESKIIDADEESKKMEEQCVQQ